MRNSAQTHPADGLDLAALSRRFEAALLEEDPPRIEQYLAQVPEPQQPALFHRLLSLEVEYLTDRDDTTAVEVYLDRFPQYADTVREVFDAVDQDEDDTELEPEPDELVDADAEAEDAAPVAAEPVDGRPVVGEPAESKPVEIEPIEPNAADNKQFDPEKTDPNRRRASETLRERPERETVVETDPSEFDQSSADVLEEDEVEPADDAEVLEEPAAEPDATYTLPEEVQVGSGRGLLLGVIAAAVVAVGFSAWGLWQLVMQPQSDDTAEQVAASNDPSSTSVEAPEEPTPDSSASPMLPDEQPEEPTPRTAQRPSTADQTEPSEAEASPSPAAIPPSDPASATSAAPPADAERSAETALLQAGALISLGGQQHVRLVHISGHPLTDQTVAHLSDLPQIAELYAADCELGDTQLDVIGGLTSLVRLDLAGNPITDAGLEMLVGLSNLRTLNLAGTGVTDAGVSQLQQALPNLSIQR